MIRSLRKRHLGIMTGLTLVLPLLLAWGLVNREQVPTVTDFGLLQQKVLPEHTYWNGELRHPEFEGRVWSWQDEKGWRLSLDVHFPNPKPDVLAYISAESEVIPPPAGLLLGEVLSNQLQTFHLPGNWSGRDLVLSFYSLAHRAPIGSQRIPAAAFPNEDPTP